MSDAEIRQITKVVSKAIGEIPFAMIGRELSKIVTVIVEYVDHVLGLVEAKAAQKAFVLIESYLKSKGYNLSIDQRDSVIGMIDRLREVAADQTKIGVPPKPIEKPKKQRFSLVQLFRVKK